MKADSIPYLHFDDAAAQRRRSPQIFVSRSDGGMSAVSFRVKLLFIVLYTLAAVVICYQYLRAMPCSIYQLVEPEPLVVDAYESYCVLPNAFEPSKWLREEVDGPTRSPDWKRVTLVLHLSADYLDEKLLEQVSNWNGPVSLSIVLTQPERQLPCAQKFLLDLASDNHETMRNLRAHYVFMSKNCTPALPLLDESLECPRIGADETSKSVEAIASYPVNVARNVARKYATSKFILIADYEHMFSEGFERRMREIAERETSRDPKIALVYRIFEVNQTVQNPRTKADLGDLLNNGTAMVFHAKYYAKAHAIIGLSEWLAKNDSKDGIFMRNLTFDRANWEPQFVSLATIPKHDENFPYMIRDNTCLRWEMCRAGYSMVLVDDLFMFHRGIKLKNSSQTRKLRKVQKANKRRFLKALKLFNDRMDLMYPQTKKMCPRFKA